MGKNDAEKGDVWTEIISRKGDVFLQAVAGYMLGYRDRFAFLSTFDCFACNPVRFSGSFDIKVLLAFKIRHCFGNSFKIRHFITR